MHTGIEYHVRQVIVEVEFREEIGERLSASEIRDAIDDDLRDGNYRILSVNPTGRVLNEDDYEERLSTVEERISDPRNMEII